jgi:hypothetical protein
MRKKEGGLLMGSIKSIAAAACAALLLTSAATTAQTPQDRLTNVTFSGPVSIPGKTLPAGTYVFKLADSPADRHIVQVFDKDQTQIYATLLAVPAERAEADGDPVITFKETPSDRPPAVRYWYYAGERSGNEFVYPKSQAMTIARATGESVMAIDTDSTNIEDWKTGKTSRVTGTAEPQSSTAASTSTTTSTDTTTTSSQPTTPVTSGSTTTSQPTTPPTTTQPTTTSSDQTTRPAAPVTAQPTTPPDTTTQPTTAQPTTSQPTPETVGTSGRSELPRTASELPAVGLIGVFALAGALVFRVARRAHA